MHMVSLLICWELFGNQAASRNLMSTKLQVPEKLSSEEFIKKVKLSGEFMLRGEFMKMELMAGEIMLLEELRLTEEFMKGKLLPEEFMLIREFTKKEL
jgi:hypothetical protein